MRAVAGGDLDEGRGVELREVVVEGRFFFFFRMASNKGSRRRSLLFSSPPLSKANSYQLLQRLADVRVEDELVEARGAVLGEFFLKRGEEKRREREHLSSFLMPSIDGSTTPLVLSLLFLFFPPKERRGSGDRRRALERTLSTHSMLGQRKRRCGEVQKKKRAAVAGKENDLLFSLFRRRRFLRKNSHSLDRKKKTTQDMADVLARLEDGSLAAVDGGLLAEKVESAVSLLDRTLDLYG